MENTVHTINLNTADYHLFLWILSLKCTMIHIIVVNLSNINAEKNRRY